MRVAWITLTLLVANLLPGAGFIPYALAETAAPSAEIRGVRLWRSPESTRLVFDLSSPAEHRLFQLRGPERIVIDIERATLRQGLEQLPLEKSPIERIRYGTQPDGGVRVVFDLRAPVTPRSFVLPKHADKPDRLVIDLDDLNSDPVPTAAQDASAASATNSPVTNSPATSSQAAQPSQVAGARLKEASAQKSKVLSSQPAETANRPQASVQKESPQKESVQPASTRQEAVSEAKPLPEPKPVKSAPVAARKILIAIDAGHGGEDPGAIGPKGLREKDVVLDIAKKLVQRINAVPGFQGRLVRTGDYYISLKGRRDKARAWRADLFVSIHADAFHNAKAQGASVFALSRHGATSETARFLAQKENDADRIGGVGGVSLSDKDDVLAGVLVDLSMTAALTSSLDVGALVLKEMGGLSRLHKRHVEQAGFMVLKSPDVPSILVETGFISNPHEAQKLASQAYRDQMARAIFKGIHQYFTRHPPPGSQLAAQSPAALRHYVVAQGDTLSGIAKAHGVSAEQLRKANKLRSDTVKIGQRLAIPQS
jgi:N-acetylmuramoyl-L-alanine amidase